MRAALFALVIAFLCAPAVTAQPRMFYPSEAQAQGIGGQAVVECLVGDDGRLACEVTEETPANMAFGLAALRMMEQARVAPRTRDGVPTAGGRIRRTFVFEPGPPARVIQDPSTVTGVRWEEMPDGHDFARLYPREAMRRGVSGRVGLSCIVNEEHRLDCEIIDEDPMEMGFGAATLELSREFRVAPLTEDGTPTIGQRIRRTIRWEMQ
ncbi:MAG: hypothetical protein A4S17_01650 [Proteobacteria bacterium HN_bin10]|nr:MAG: hypothetical protein A4S17_01650 [Proteobacteria bacterium HN_bin10]